jgi:pyruvate ferredoxin oxidoreductase gamma subunit
VPATEVARRAVGKPLPNAALLGGFAALTAQITLASVNTAIRERFARTPAVAERNVAAAAEVFASARQTMAADGRAVLGVPAD